jgi:hypothetical protein
MMSVIFPRSGTHLLLHIFKQQLDHELHTAHHQREADCKVINVVRDPHEAIHSAAVMRVHYGLEPTQDDLIRYYTDLHDYMFSRADYVIDYNTLANSPDTVRDYLAEELGLSYNGKPYVDVTKDKPEVKYLVSSKTSQFYSTDFLDGYDLTKAYESYNKLLSRKNM